MVTATSKPFGQYTDRATWLKGSFPTSCPQLSKKGIVPLPLVGTFFEVPRINQGPVFVFKKLLARRRDSHAVAKTSKGQSVGPNKLSGRIGWPEICSSWERCFWMASRFARKDSESSATAFSSTPCRTCGVPRCHVQKK